MAGAISRRKFIQAVALSGAMAALPACVRSGARTRVHPEPTLEQKLAQMLLVGFRGTTLESSSSIVRDIGTHGIGGVILYDRDALLQTNGRNIASPQQLQALTAALKALSAHPLFVAVDQEGGKVARLKEPYGFRPSVSAQSLGRSNDLAITRSRAEAMAAELRENGITMNYAPVVDLNVNPDNPVIGRLERSFSADPAIVTAHAREFITAHDRCGISTCIKHFPGHGSSTSDSHLGFTDITDTWSDVELEPYRHLIGSGQCRMVMTAHVFNRHLDAEYPATLSPAIITGILRERLGYDGVVVSDDMQMAGLAQFYDFPTIVEKTVLAGVDMILVANNLVYDPDVVPRTLAILLKSIDSGRIPVSRIDASYRRIMALKYRYAGATS